MDLNILGKIMQGGADKVIEAGGTLAGGHSIADSDVKYGLSVMGTVHPKHIYSNNMGQPSDVLILTKKLGVGLVCNANRVGEAPLGAIEDAVSSMTTLNRAASEISHSFEIHACTDVTGFSFLGHLSEMLNDDITAHGVKQRINNVVLTGQGIVNISKSDVAGKINLNIPVKMSTGRLISTIKPEFRTSYALVRYIAARPYVKSVSSSIDRQPNESIFRTIIDRVKEFFYS